MKKNLLLTVLVALLSITIKGQCTFGNYPPTFTANPGWTNGAWLAKRFTLASTATLSGLGLNAAVNSLTQYRMAVYTDASSMPGNFVAATNQGTMVIGQNALAVQTPTVIPPGTYWLMAFYNSSGTPTTYSNSTLPMYYMTGSIGTNPANMASWVMGGNYDVDYWAIINSPTVTITGNNTVCSGAALNLTASGAITYSWSTGVMGNSLLVNPTTNTVYAAVGLGANGCPGLSNTLSVTILPQPTITVTGNNTITCSGQPVYLTASGGMSYLFSNSTVTNPATVTPMASGPYSVIGTDANGCNGTATVVILVVPSPTVMVTGNNTVCAGSTATLNASGASSYAWSNGGSGATLTPAPASNTTYTVVGTGTNGCTDIKTIALTINPLPTMTISGNTSVCAGNSISLTANAGVPIVSFLWVGTPSPMSGASIITSPTASTVYTVTIIDAYNCKGESSFAVTVHALPSLTVTSNKPLICAGQNATISVTGVSSGTWNSGANGLQLPVTPTVTTTYTITGSNANNCMNSASFTQSVEVCTGVSKHEPNNVLVSIFPNPSHGIFKLEMASSGDHSIEVFNANGALVKSETTDSDKTELNLNNCADGLYYLVVRTKEKQTVLKLMKH